MLASKLGKNLQQILGLLARQRNITHGVATRRTVLAAAFFDYIGWPHNVVHCVGPQPRQAPVPLMHTVVIGDRRP